MIIQQKRIRKPDKYLKLIRRGTEILIAAPINSETQQLLQRIGFKRLIENGETVLPSPVFGNMSLFNAEGKYKIRKDLPKETAYRQVEWHWEQWCGYGETEEMSKIVDVSYERYPREFIEPPGIELTIGSSKNGDRFVISPSIKYQESEDELLVHIINLFLEIFGIAHVLQKNLREIEVPTTKRLNWTILPQGEYPWEKVEPLVKPIIDKAKEGNRPVISNRYSVISRYNPDFVAVGQAGFSGYLIFGFTSKTLFICESAFYGNATYIFESDWEALSKLSKAEILNEELQKDRIIHREGWEEKIENLLK